MTKPIGIIGAMEEEVRALIDQLTNTQITNRAGLQFVQGSLREKAVVVVRCGIGKVNAALCTQILIDHFNVRAIINTGVAGGLAPDIEIGDIVISTSSVHHDFDTTVFGYQKGTIPRMTTSMFTSDITLRQLAVQAGEHVLGQSRVHQGLVASGDQFISSVDQKKQIVANFPGLCAEMEGAAIAHVAMVNDIPYVIIRAISDKADNSAPEDFDQFLLEIIPDLNSVVQEVVTDY